MRRYRPGGQRRRHRRSGKGSRRRSRRGALPVMAPVETTAHPFRSAGRRWRERADRASREFFARSTESNQSAGSHDIQRRPHVSGSGAASVPERRERSIRGIQILPGERRDAYRLHIGLALDAQLCCARQPDPPGGRLRSPYRPNQTVTTQAANDGHVMEMKWCPYGTQRKMGRGCKIRIHLVTHYTI